MCPSLGSFPIVPESNAIILLLALQEDHPSLKSENSLHCLPLSLLPNIRLTL